MCKGSGDLEHALSECMAADSDIAAELCLAFIVSTALQQARGTFWCASDLLSLLVAPFHCSENGPAQDGEQTDRGAADGGECVTTGVRAAPVTGAAQL